jgi:GTP-binding protein
MNQTKLRNIAIIAHVDHGKTTLVDAMLKQTQTFAAHEKELEASTILDSNELEREKGVTILAKNIAVTWKDYKINILDTPGHADFSGEVERVLNMADGCILLVDAAEGVLSQTKFVLRLALKLGLTPIVVINKVDRKDQRVKEVETEIGDLFLDLATTEDQLNFPILYAKGIEGVAGQELELQSNGSFEITDSNNLSPLFKTLIEHVPAPKGNPNKPLQLQINALDWDDHLGKIIIGRIFRGKITRGQKICVLKHKKETEDTHRQVFTQVDYLFVHMGLSRQAVNQASAGEIVALTGIKNPRIGETIADAQQPESLPALPISEPTVKIQLSVNTSPMAGQEADYSTSRQLRNRLDRELEINVGLRLEPGSSADGVTLVGRGELHLAILIETMRREGYEFSLSRPEVVLKEIDGKFYEPWEQVFIEAPESYTGYITASMSKRRANLINMTKIKDYVRFEYEIATSNLIGYRDQLLTNTSGEGVLNNSFLEFRLQSEAIEWNRGGAIVAHQPGQTTIYALDKAQQRGRIIVDPGEQVYAGQVVGFNKRSDDMTMNVCKGKQLTNMRSATADATVVLAPAWKPSLEQFLTLIAKDEMLEVTPKSLRLRKKNLNVF